LYQRIAIQAFLRDCRQADLSDEESALRAEVADTMIYEKYHDPETLFSSACTSVLHWMTGMESYRKHLLHCVLLCSAVSLLSGIVVSGLFLMSGVFHQAWIVVAAVPPCAFLAWFIREEGGF
jgi:hypothetical protein